MFVADRLEAVKWKNGKLTFYDEERMAIVAAFERSVAPFPLIRPGTPDHLPAPGGPLKASFRSSTSLGAVTDP